MQAVNPYLPGWEYIPDAEPYVFGDRVYIYGSHDRFDGDVYCQNDYVCWSAPVHELGAWRFEGVIYRKEQDPRNANGAHYLYAPDIQRGIDGRYYLYYALDNVGIMSVAVCDTPAGAFAYYGDVRYENGDILGERPGDLSNFDPGVLVDSGKVYLYSGFAPRREWFSGSVEQAARHQGAYFMELGADMLTVIDGPRLTLKRAGDADGTGFEGHEFFEASSLRKVGDRYYFIYSSVNGHELCYAIGDAPDGPFWFGGTLISNGDVFLQDRALNDALNYTGNNHGSIVEIAGQWYVFYHRQTNLHQFSRQACAEKIVIGPDGSIGQVEMTSCGLNCGPLVGNGTYEARIACNLLSAKGTQPYAHNQKMAAGDHPYLTQDCPDDGQNAMQFIANLRNGSMAGYKYFDLHEPDCITVRIRGNGEGIMRVSTVADGESVAEISIDARVDWSDFSAKCAPFSGVAPLFFLFLGEGAIDFASFTFH